MNKKGQMVALIAIAIAAIILLLFFRNSLDPLLKRAGSQSTCDLNLLLSAAVKAGSLGFSEIPPGCEANYLTVGKQEIDARKNIAKKRLDKYYQDNTGYYADARTTFNVQSGVTDTALNEWSLDYVMGKELADCWNKVWHGKLDIVKRNPAQKRIYCIVCDVITFGEDLPSSLKAKTVANPVSSLYTWTKSEPYFKTTYYDFLQDGMTFKPTQSDMTFSTDTTTAIVYIESKKGWLVSALPGIAYTVAGGITAVLIVSGVGTPAGILGSVLLGTAAGTTGAAAGIGAAAGTAAIQQALEKDAQTLGQAVKEKEVKAVGLAPYEGLSGLCTDIIA